MEQGEISGLCPQMGGGAAVAGRADADPHLAFVLLRLAEDIVGPATAVDAEAELSADSFALDEVGCALLSALRDWARDSPTTAVPGIARSIIRFTVNVIPDPDHADTADTLEAMRDEPGAGSRGALRTRCAPLTAPPHRMGAPVRWCAHRVRPVRTTRCSPTPSVRREPSGRTPVRSMSATERTPGSPAGQ
ncbi:hypothetical protein AB0D13_40545 [Streptomyces sp. NPDC048430]|uniref:hypothetical protein n=1 Tax=Streptomyces sp. NPDC048430 TaxID=3155388 RepID=UPI003428B4D5